MRVIHSICIRRQQLEPVETQRKKNCPLKLSFTRRRRPLAGKRCSTCVTSATTTALEARRDAKQHQTQCMEQPRLAPHGRTLNQRSCRPGRRP